jgi:hypothetical protein
LVELYQNSALKDYLDSMRLRRNGDAIVEARVVGFASYTAFSAL